ncbi:MAG: NIPSNAP family protein [Chryseolinea sp.]
MKYLHILLLSCVSLITLAAPPKREFYEIRVYYLKDNAQEEKIDAYLKNALIPALHRASIPAVGVYKPVEADSTAGKRIYVLIPYNSLDQFTKMPGDLLKDSKYLADGKEYLDASYEMPPYNRMQKILLQAFTGLPRHEVPKLTSPKADRVYELRSYESHSEKISTNKVKMFNDGDEVGLFKRLDFNAVFYAEVLSGSRMPNLMYMTSFENMAARDEHWKTFVDDAQWKVVSKLPEYQHNVSRNEIRLLKPAEYSEL